MFKKTSSNALTVPPVAKTDPIAVEVLRVWAAPGEAQEIVLRTTWKDPAAWGLVIADIARHAAKAYAAEGEDEKAVLLRIRQMFDAEWASPTDLPKEITERKQ